LISKAILMEIGWDGALGLQGSMKCRTTCYKADRYSMMAKMYPVRHLGTVKRTAGLMSSGRALVSAR
jgi:hypothetical protein